MIVCSLGTELQGRGSTRLDRKHVKASLAPAKQSMHNNGAQHHSQMVLAVSRYWGGWKTRVPGAKPQSRPIIHPAYAPGRNQTRVIAVEGASAYYCFFDFCSTYETDQSCKFDFRLFGVFSIRGTSLQLSKRSRNIFHFRKSNKW